MCLSLHLLLLSSTNLASLELHVYRIELCPYMEFLSEKDGNYRSLNGRSYRPRRGCDSPTWDMGLLVKGPVTALGLIQGWVRDGNGLRGVFVVHLDMWHYKDGILGRYWALYRCG